MTIDKWVSVLVLHQCRRREFSSLVVARFLLHLVAELQRVHLCHLLWSHTQLCRCHSVERAEELGDVLVGLGVMHGCSVQVLQQLVFHGLLRLLERLVALRLLQRSINLGVYLVALLGHELLCLDTAVPIDVGAGVVDQRLGKLCADGACQQLRCRDDDVATSLNLVQLCGH